MPNPLTYPLFLRRGPVNAPPPKRAVGGKVQKGVAPHRTKKKCDEFPRGVRQVEAVPLPLLLITSSARLLLTRPSSTFTTPHSDKASLKGFIKPTRRTLKKGIRRPLRGPPGPLRRGRTHAPALDPPLSGQTNHSFGTVSLCF